MKKLFVVSGPSGVGLGDVIAKVVARRQDLGEVTPITARKMKKGETDGVGFWFYDLEGWNALKEAGGILECTEFAGNDYGTSRRLVQEQLEKGKNVLLNLTVDRACQVKANMPESVCVYLEPSPEQMQLRLQAISRSSFEQAVRQRRAEEERAASGFCDARINTDDLERAAEELSALMDESTK